MYIMEKEHHKESCLPVPYKKFQEANMWPGARHILQNHTPSDSSPTNFYEPIHV